MSETNELGEPVIMLQSLNGRKLSSDLSLQVASVLSKLRELVQFELRLLKGPGSLLSVDPVFSGLLSEAHPTGLDGVYFENARFPSEIISLSREGLDIQLFRILGGLISAGGSFTLSHTLNGEESTIHKQIAQALERGYPPVVTPLGDLLFLAGCGMSFKNMGSSELGQVGSEILQGFKPHNTGRGEKWDSVTQRTPSIHGHSERG